MSIWLATPLEELTVRFEGRLVERRQKLLVVHVVVKNLLAAIAPAHHPPSPAEKGCGGTGVIHGPGVLKAKFARHDRHTTIERPAGQQ